MKKKSMKEKINDKKTIKINIAMSILLVVVLSFISLGYALYGQTLNITGSYTFGLQGKIAITDITLTSSKNVRSDSIPEFTDDSVDFNLTFEKAEGSTEPNYQAVYSITIDNGTFYNYDFNLANFQPIIKNSSGVNVDPSYLNYTLEGINLGDSIPAGESVTFTLIMDFTPEEDDTYSVDGEMGTDLVEQPHGTVLGSVPENFEGNLKKSEDKNIVELPVTVINSYQTPRTFSLQITDTSHFQLVDSNGNALSSLTINAGTTQVFTIYVKRVETAKFLSASFTPNIQLSYAEGSNINCGSITLLVDEEDDDDITPPEVSNITVTTNDATSETTTNNNVGSVTLNWTGIDAESGVEKYYVILYKGNNATGTTYETADSNPQLTITGLEDGNYWFKVYGENKQHYKPSASEIESCNNNYCSKTTSSSYTWHFTIILSDNSSNIKSISPTAVNRGKNVTVTISPNTYTDQQCGQTTTNYYTISTSITVTMGGTRMTSGNGRGQYQFSRTTSGNYNGTLNLYGVTGNIEITATASK